MNNSFSIFSIRFVNRYLLCIALEEKVRLGEKKADGLYKEKVRLETDLESMTKKSHDASGQLVIISQELLKKERYRVKLFLIYYGCE